MWMNPAGDDVASAESRSWSGGILHTSAHPGQTHTLSLTSRNIFWHYFQQRTAVFVSEDLLDLTDRCLMMNDCSLGPFAVTLWSM